MKLDFFKEITNNLDNKVQDFINDLSEYLNKSKEEVFNEPNESLNNLREEDCLYYVIDSDLETVYLQNLNNNIKFRENDLSPEIKKQVFTDCILRYKNGKYIWDKELTDKFMATLVSAVEFNKIKEKFIKETNIQDNEPNTKYNVLLHEEDYTTLSYENNGIKTVNVPNVLMPFGVNNKKVYIYKNGKFELSI